ncbi:hypothetical protein D9M68_787410 [compost metagenome]
MVVVPVMLTVFAVAAPMFTVAAEASVAAGASLIAPTLTVKPFSTPAKSLKLVPSVDCRV